MLFPNVSRITHNPLRYSAYHQANERFMWGHTLYNHMNKYTGGWSQYNGIPSGYGPHYTWGPPLKSGGCATSIPCEGDVYDALLANAKNCVSTLAGTGVLTEASLSNIVNMAVAILGQGIITEAQLAGILTMVASLVGTGVITEAQLGAIINLVTTLTGTGTLSYTELMGLFMLSAHIYVNTGSADVDQLVAGVWDANASKYNTGGTMGQKLNAAGTAGDPWTTDLPGPYTGVQAGKIVGEYVDQKISEVPGDVWEEPIASHTTTGTYGLIVSKIKAWVGWLRSLL
jgi:hypothetical protein